MFTKKVILIKFLILIISTTLNAADLSAEVKVSPVGSFTAEIKGFQAVAIKKADGSFSANNIKIPWENIETGMNLRNKHAKKYVNAEKHPNIEISTAIGKKGNGAAKVKFNDIEKIIKGTYEITENNLIANFTIKLSDFGIKDVSFKGAGVQDEIKAKITLPIKTEVPVQK